MAKGGKRPGAGRPPGVPNKTTADVRAAIAVFAQNNVEQMGSWLADIEDPAKRLDLFLRAIEYHVPKLQRTERTIADATDEELLAEVRRRAAGGQA